MVGKLYHSVISLYSTELKSHLFVNFSDLLLPACYLSKIVWGYNSPVQGVRRALTGCQQGLLAPVPLLPHTVVVGAVNLKSSMSNTIQICATFVTALLVSPVISMY